MKQAIKETINLFGDAFRAIIKPHRAFGEIDENTPFHYRILIPFMMFWGLVHIFIPYTDILGGRYLWDAEFAPQIATYETLWGFLIWLNGVFVLYLINRALKKKISLRRLEIAVFYVWVVWAASSFFDIPHSLIKIYSFPIKLGSVAELWWHFAWFFALPVIIIQFFFIFRDLFGFNKKKLLHLAFFASILGPFIFRIFIETIPEVLTFIFRVGPGPSFSSYKQITIFIMSSALVLILCWRLRLAGYYFRNYAPLLGFSLVLLFVIGLSLIDVRYLPGQGQALSSQVVVTGEFGLGFSRETHSQTWTGGDYETGSQTIAGNSPSCADRNTTITYTDVINLPFDPSKVTITQIRCRVNFTTATDGTGGDGLPAARCDFRPDAGSWCSGTAWINMTGAGERTQTWTSSSCWSGITQLNNSVRVYMSVDGTGDAYGCTYDVLTYDNVYIDITYTGDTISGSLYSDEGITKIAVAKTIKLKVNGVDRCGANGTSACTATTSSGDYTFSDVVTGSGDILTVWVDGAAEDAVTVTKTNGGDLIGVNKVDLYQDHAIVRAETGTLTINDMNYYDQTQDSDIFFNSTRDVYAGSMAGGIIYRCDPKVDTYCDVTGDWTTSYDSSEARIWSLTFDSIHGVVYAGTYATGNIYRCDVTTGCNEGGDWTTVYSEGAISHILALEFDSTNGVVYAGSSEGNIYRCDTATRCDAAGDWTYVDTGEIMVYSLEFDSNNNIMYAGTGTSGKIFHCDTSTDCDVAGDWTMAFDSNETYIYSLAYDTGYDVIYAGSGESGIIYRCTSDCDTMAYWKVSYDTNETRIWSLAAEDGNYTIFAGTEPNGIIYRCQGFNCDAAGDWTAVYDTPETAIYSLVYMGGTGAVYSENYVMWAGTGANGRIYRCMIVPDICEESGDWSIANDTSETNILSIEYSERTLAVAEGKELFIWGGDTFTPGGNVRTHDIKIVGTYTASGAESITVSGSWVKSGTFTYATSTVTFEASSGSEYITGTGTNDFYNIVFNDGGGSADWTIASHIDVNGDLTITGGGLYAFFFSTTNINVAGSWTNNDWFVCRDSTVTFDATSPGKTISGNLTGSTGGFYKVNFNGTGSAAWTIQDPIEVDSGTANATDTFQVSDGVVTLGNGTGDNLEVAGGKFVVASGATFQTYPSLAQGQSIIIDINQNTSPRNCSNCIISNSGTFDIAKNVTLRLNSYSSVQTGIEVESTGYLEIQGTKDYTGADRGTDDAVTRETLICVNEAWTADLHNSKHVRMTSGLAIGKIYTITDTIAGDTNCATDTDDSITRADNSSATDANPDVTGGAACSGSATCTINIVDALISADNEGIGRYLHNLTDDKYYRIVDSVEAAQDTITIITDEPDAFTTMDDGDDIEITDGIKFSDTFEILDYAIITAESTNHGYIYAKAGSETLIQYADISELGANGIYANSVDASNLNEGITINKSRIHDGGGSGIYMLSSPNNNAANSAGITDNAIYSNSANGFYPYDSNNNTFSSNIVYNNSSYGVWVRSSSNNTLSSNIAYKNSNDGFYLSTSSNNTLSSNIAYNNSAFSGFYLFNGSHKNVLSLNTAFGNSSYGFYLSTSSNNTLSSNSVYSNTTAGFYLYSNSNNNILSSNTAYSTNLGFYLVFASHNNTFFSNSIYSNAYGLYNANSSGGIAVNDDYGVSGANNTADIGFSDSSSGSNFKLFGVDLASSTEVSEVTYSGAYVISEDHDPSSQTGQTKIWGEYTVPDDMDDTASIDEDIQQFNYANNLYPESFSEPGYSGTGSQDTDLDLEINGSLGGSPPYAYRLICITANTIFDVQRFDSSGTQVDAGNATVGSQFTDGTTNVQFTIQDVGTNYAVGDTYTFVVWDDSGDSNTQKILNIQQSGDKITVGSGETFELKGGGLASDNTDESRITASALWDLSNSGTITVQEAVINYLNLASGNLTVLNTTLNNEDTPDAGTNLYVDWYLGAHVVNAINLTNINTGDTDVTISENSGIPASTIWKWSGSGWGSPATSQATGTNSNGLIPQPGNNDAIRIREYARTSAGYTFYKYNIQVAEQSNYGEYDYYADQGNNYITSTLNTGSGEDEVISENWRRYNIDVNNTEPALDQPPTNGTWYLGMLPLLEFSIDSSSVSFAELNSGNNFTDTKTSTLITTTSADSGYVITAWSTQLMTHTGYPSYTISDWAGTNTVPTEWGTDCPGSGGSYCGFGYTTDDTTLSGGTADRFSGPKYAGFVHSGAGDPVADETTSGIDSQHVITYKISADTSKVAGDYQTTIVYICTATY